MTKPKTPTQSDPCPNSPSGAHWWLVEPFIEGNGGIVGAACRECGATRTYDAKPVVKGYA